MSPGLPMNERSTLVCDFLGDVGTATLGKLKMKEKEEHLTKLRGCRVGSR
jgi:hypothetical protein